MLIEVIIMRNLHPQFLLMLMIETKVSPKTFLFTLSFLFVAIVLTVRQISS